MPSGGLKLWILSYQGSAAFDNIVLVATGATTTPKQ
jgi:hypothetical protein